MFEFEATRNRRKVDLEPSERACFADPAARIEAISLIPWEEHCTECAMPACFDTCDLYTPRGDGKCRRFVHDIALVENVPTAQGYAVRVEFKRWAQLMAYANAHMVPIRRARRLERMSLVTDRLAASLPGQSLRIAGVDRIPQKAERRLKRWLGSAGVFADRMRRPDYFVVEVHNPADRSIRLSLTIRNPEGSRSRFAFQELLEVTPGFNRIKIDADRISELVDLSGDLQILLSPNILKEEDEGLTLFFGTVGFVADLAYRTEVAAADRSLSEAKPVKIVIWDLDNTIWDGVLVEDGPEGLKLKPEVHPIIEELDRRGIVNSVVSKNDNEYAMAQLERFGLAEYIVFPRIGWGPKGEAVAAVIDDFNVNADTVLFIDDQPFEREQVQSVVPAIRVMDGRNYAGILDLDVMNPEQSSESSRRRHFYQSQKIRRSAEISHQGDYEAFLERCEIRLGIDPDGVSKSDRVHELVQRTNQMNFSGNRYSREQIEEILRDPHYDHYVLSCSDKFGEYGIIGFSLVERSGPCMIDLMFSCRIQSKRVEHAFLAFLCNRYKDAGAERFEARYRRTERNAASGRVFADLGFVEEGRTDGLLVYSYDLRHEIQSDGIIDIVWEG